MNNFKNFICTFNINEFSGYKSKIKLLDFKSFKKIQYPGIEIVSTSNYRIEYRIELQLIRKLKLMNINNDIKNNTKEDIIWYFYNKSKECEDFNSYSSQWYSSQWSYTDYKEYDNIDKEEKREKNRFLINQSKNYSQKVKRYENKGRLRK